MSFFHHNELPMHEVPRIRTRILVSADRGAKETAIWEQWIYAEGRIPLHYHEVEEVLIILEGKARLTLNEEITTVTAPVTIVIPARQLHALQPQGEEEVHLLAFFPTNDPKIYAPDGTLRPLPWEDRES